jgi:phospho-N-acetylmuramoyl-pentapeptide-transferase
LTAHIVFIIFVSFLINILISPYAINLLHKLKFGQPIRNDGPKSHMIKANTPTMGGVIFMLSIIIASTMFIKNNLEVILILLMTIGFGLIGFIDDFIKIIKKQSLGLKAYQKIVLQLIVVGIFFWYIQKFIPNQNYYIVYVPFINKLRLNLGMYFVPFVYFFMIATVNSINLTDGLDGLAAGVTTLVIIFFLYISLILNNDSYIIAAIAIGSLLSFLLFNSHPAKIFMGDAGSFALGGLVASMAIILRMPLFLIIVGVIYVIESLSVIMQVIYFKITSGKRIFKMTPFHHHLELSGWSETKIVAVFYLITALACLIVMKTFHI